MSTNANTDYVNHPCSVELRDKRGRIWSGTLILDGYDNAESVIRFKFDDVKKWYNKKSIITDDQCGCSYGDMRIKCPQGIVFWITDLSMRENPIVLSDFDQKENELAMGVA